VGIDVGVSTHPGVQEQQAAGVVDEVAQAGLDPRAPGAGFPGGPDEVPEVYPPYPCIRILHGVSLPPG
jgi:hypothetical protein